MKIAFDLDGTLYDTFPKIFEVDKSILRDFGYKEPSSRNYKSKFQSKNWNKFYRDLGVQEQDLKKIDEEFYRRYSLLDPPELIPEAKTTLSEIEKVIGHKNIFIITNEHRERVCRRFIRDGLEHYLSRVDCPTQGKSQELYNIATKNNGGLFFYIGDLVSDGEDCIEARNAGANNLRFCGIVHPYSMNLKGQMLKFVSENRHFSQVVNNLRDVSKLLD